MQANGAKQCADHGVNTHVICDTLDQLHYILTGRIVMLLSTGMEAHHEAFFV